MVSLFPVLGLTRAGMRIHRHESNPDLKVKSKKKGEPEWRLLFCAFAAHCLTLSISFLTIAIHHLFVFEISVGEVVV